MSSETFQHLENKANNYMYKENHLYHRV